MEDKIFSQKLTSQLNDFSNFLKFQPTWLFKKMLHCPQKKIALFTGNRAGKTAGVAYQYVMRILGIHPVPEKNVVYYECPEKHKYLAGQARVILDGNGKCSCGEDIKIHERSCRIFRFSSATLPEESSNTDSMGTSAEIRNTQYPEFKKWLPPFLIKEDIKARNKSMIIRDPYGGRDIITELSSYSQEVQSTAGVSRLGVWLDEESPWEYYQEQLPRLIEEDGDMIFSLTPANFISWTYDTIFEKAAVYYRTPSVCGYLAKEGKGTVSQEEHTDSPYSIAVLQASSYDNPILDKKAIETAHETTDDPDLIAIRVYGIHKQVSGKIFKDFDYATHVIDGDKYFPDGIPSGWVFARGIDYHPQTPWAVGMIALSPHNEAFIFGELNMSPEKYTTREIAHAVAVTGRHYNFRLNLIDPLAKATKKDLRTILDDLNESFSELKHEGIGTGGFWQAWDTKGEKGRDAIMARLKNSKRVGRPFNNKIIENGIEKQLPTLWIFNTCKISIHSMASWRWEEWSQSSDRHTKEDKNTPQQKWSHHNMVYECIFKEPSFKPSVVDVRPSYQKAERKTPHYFQMR